MTLQILIPQYDETDDIIKPLLDSIALQQNVDFSEIGVIICNDGSDVFLSESLLSQYPFDVQYYSIDHSGVSAARQACLNQATAEYVMFCDADDMFCNLFGLWFVFREMEGDGFDTFTSAFWEESKDPETGQTVYLSREEDVTFVHGKVQRRQYLIDKNIAWDPDLKVHEDSYFNCLTQYCVDDPGRVKYCPTQFYLWKWRDESVSRRDPKYVLKTYRYMLDSDTALVNQFLQRGLKEKAEYFCANMIYDAYYTMNMPAWNAEENREDREATEARITEYLQEFMPLFDETSDAIKRDVSTKARDRLVVEGLLMEKFAFDDWISQR